MRDIVDKVMQRDEVQRKVIEISPLFERVLANCKIGCYGSDAWPNTTGSRIHSLSIGE